MEHSPRFFQSIQRNLLAIISLLLALASLSYNTWRNESTEQNRNQRAAGFAVLHELAALQLLTDHITYGEERGHGDTIAGWTRVIFISDLAHLTSPALEAKAKALEREWTEQVGALPDSAKANKAVSAHIKAAREQAMKSIEALK